MALGTGQPENPLLAPWPPGVDHRFVVDPRHGALVQLRPGARTPRELVDAEIQCFAGEQHENQLRAEDWFRRTHGRLRHA